MALPEGSRPPSRADTPGPGVGTTPSRPGTPQHGKGKACDSGLPSPTQEQQYSPEETTAPTDCGIPPPVPHRSPLRRSTCLKKVTHREGNIYGEDRPPSTIERDIDSAQQCKRLMEFDEGSSQPQIPGGFEPEEEEPTFPAGMFPQEEEELQYADPQERDSSHSERAEQHHTGSECCCSLCCVRASLQSPCRVLWSCVLHSTSSVIVSRVLWKLCYTPQALSLFPESWHSVLCLPLCLCPFLLVSFPPLQSPWCSVTQGPFESRF